MLRIISGVESVMTNDRGKCLEFAKNPSSRDGVVTNDRMIGVRKEMERRLQKVLLYHHQYQPS
ncbi:unnamed protein product [Orchesella dallaii]|uniref:Uncharacterized protein n=1 Tax=Orchesella dallaii TaxID=48710 RepID=A0ABP1QQ22_9HEXA